MALPVAARPLEHKLPPIVANRWRRVTFILTTGDRFMNALEINDLFEQESPVGRLYVKLREMGIQVEREWWIDEEGIALRQGQRNSRVGNGGLSQRMG